MHAAKFRHLILTLAVLLGLCAPPLAFAEDDAVHKYWSDDYGEFQPSATNTYNWSVIAKAQPDECFFGLNDSRNIASFFAVYPGDLSSGYGTCMFAKSSGRPKVNQAYVWGLTKHGSDLWYGTIANTLCLVIEGLGSTGGLQFNTVECEGTPSADARPPRIFLYDTKNNALTDMTGAVKSAGNPHYGLLLSTLGLRSAGSLGDVVILGGLSFIPDGKGGLISGVGMFAFNGKTRTFIGSKFFPNYKNIRQWIVVNKRLYVGVADDSNGLFTASKGEILHWIGSTSSPFLFETVGTVGGDPAYLTHFDGRIFVSTWGGPPGSYGTALYMSPKFSDKLPPSTTLWGSVWQLSNYEVEPSAGAAGGAIQGFDGWLYFSTMIPPGAAIEQFVNMYGAPPDTASYAKDFLGSYRPTVMFRGKNFGTKNQKIELLYGNTVLPKYDKPSNSWSLVPNNLHQSPKWGLAGYNNFFNSYTWWMSKFNGELFIGTFDWSYLLFEAVFDQYGAQIPPAVIAAARSFEGADLLRLHSSSDSPVAVSLNGMGNYSNYGVRTMMELNGKLYLGTANPFNLLTDPVHDPYGKTGGWELIRMAPTGGPGPDPEDD